MSRKARAYATLSRWRGGARQAADVVHAGLWLGLLDRDDLHAIDQTEYETRSNYRTDAHNLSGLFPWEQRLVDAHFPAAGPATGPVVVVGAGGGREVVGLARRGLTVTGYECNPALVDFGRDLLHRAGHPDAALDRLGRDLAPPPTGGPFAAAVVGWCAYMLIAGRPHRVAFLAGLRAVLAPDAPVLLSFWDRTPAERRTGLVAAVANPVRRIRRRPPVDRGDDLSPTYVHRFTQDEITEELADGGFRVVEYVPGRLAAGEPGRVVARPA